MSPQSYEYLMQWSWSARLDHKIWYAIRRQGNKVIPMHRQVFIYHHGYEPLMVDHEDGNGLNNQLHNLRESDHQRNGWNRGPNSTNKSKFKGVAAQPNGKWAATIQFGNKRKHLGHNFATPEAAAIAYDKAALELYSEGHLKDCLWLNTKQGGLKLPLEC